MHKTWCLARDAVSGVIESKPRLARGYRWARVVRRHGAPAGAGGGDARIGHRDGCAVGLVPL